MSKPRLFRVTLKRTIHQYKSVIVEVGGSEEPDEKLIGRAGLEQDNGSGYAADPDERIRRYIHKVEFLQ